MTDKQTVPLLTAEDAESVLRCLADGHSREDKILTIASGDAVVIPRITREALRESLAVDQQFVHQTLWSFEDIIAALKRHRIEVIP